MNYEICNEVNAYEQNLKKKLLPNMSLEHQFQHKVDYLEQKNHIIFGMCLYPVKELLLYLEYEKVNLK